MAHQHPHLLYVALNVIIDSLYTEQIYKGNAFFSVPDDIQQLRTANETDL